MGGPQATEGGAWPGLQEKKATATATALASLAGAVTALSEASQAFFWHAKPHFEAFTVSTKDLAECALLRAEEAKPHVKALAASAWELSRSAALLALTGFKDRCDLALKDLQELRESVAEESEGDSESDSASDVEARRPGHGASSATSCEIRPKPRPTCQRTSAGLLRR